MNTPEKWKKSKFRIRVISVFEMIVLVLGVVAAFKYGGDGTSELSIAVLVAVFVSHIITLILLWRCPKCGKVQPFWERGHRASVGSLTNCVYCGVTYVQT